MLARLPPPLRVAGLLGAAFLLGGGSTEVALRTRESIARVQADRESGAAGQLVALRLEDADGTLLARPRLIAPAGRTTEVVLHDSARPDVVRLAFRVDADRQPSGDISLEYTLFVPGHEVATGRLLLTPGVEQAIEIGGGELVASWLAVPVPSAAFDAFLEGEAVAARVVVRAS